ncbi:DUF2828 family protein [Paenibacillus illinoisensis]|uniref:DUF2828 family protein n=1 Tax=Paenibacillus illinoisensis TaxID=59845 RepID=UPI003015F9DD
MLNHLKAATNVAYTENGARAFATTQSALLDMFAQGGALRNRSDSDKIKLFTKAFAENSTLAMRMLFYFRDVRGGQGERNTFRVIVRYLADHHTDAMRRNLGWISYFGRWDDLYAFVGTKLEKDAFGIITSQFREDVSSERPSLLGKWLKSENASSYETKTLAKKTRESLDLTPRQYRKALSALRSRIAIVESQMSANEWTDIDYSKLPSQASLRYRQAFYRHDLDGYQGYIDSLKRGDAGVKVNTKTLYPYEIVHEIFSGKVRVGNKYNVQFGNAANEDMLNVMWENLPDYFNGNTENSLVVVDTSGSMYGLPIEIAVSLGIYAAERNKGKFHNHFMTFSNRPELVELQGTGIVERVRNMSQANWDMNTDIKRVFDLVLKTAVENSLPQDEMIGRIYIVSDMEFDGCVTGGNNQTLFQTIESEYRAAGYTMPNLVFWNVNARGSQFPTDMTATGVQLVSGASPSIFTNLLKGSMLSPYELMLDVINSERYGVIS